MIVVGAVVGVDRDPRQDLRHHTVPRRGQGTSRKKMNSLHAYKTWGGGRGGEGIFLLNSEEKARVGPGR